MSWWARRTGTRIAPLVLVTRLVRDEQPMVTDIEVYQEILHRYTGSTIRTPWTPLSMP